MPPLPPAAELLAAIVESSDDAILSKDLDGVITSWNRGAERIFGYTPQEAVGRPITLLIPEDRWHEEAHILDQVRQGQRVDHFETVRKAKDGSLLQVSVTISPIRDGEGKIVGVSKVARDITPQRLLQEKLRLSEALYRVTLSSITDAVIATGPTGRITFMNQVAEALTGWTLTEASATEFDQVFCALQEGTRARARRPTDEVIRTGHSIGMSRHLLVSRQGEERLIETKAAPIQDFGGDLLGVIVVFRDMGTQHLAELAQLRLAAIVEGSEDAIISKNLDSIVMSWNRGAQQILGYSAEDMVGRPITILLPPDRLSEEREIIRRLQAGERIQHMDTVRVSKDGRLIEVSLTISPIRDATGNVIGASKILRDISERKRIERELQGARRQLETRAGELEEKVKERTARLQEIIAELESFSYSVSHDLRAPLRAIQQYAEMLQDDYASKLDGQGAQYLKRIAASVERMDALVRDVLTYSRVVRSEVKLAPVDTDQLVRGIIEAYPTFQKPAVEIDVPDPLLPVMGSEALLTQCLSNLVANAVKFVSADRRPHIIIRTERIAERVRISVEDNGVGLAVADQARIFGMFERAHSAQSYEGTGIGLTIVRKAVDRMNGELGVESVLEKGSKFWIDLQAH